VALVSSDASLVKAAESKAAGLELIDNEGNSKGYLIPAEFDAVASQYLGSSKRWVAVTPILQSITAYSADRIQFDGQSCILAVSEDLPEYDKGKVN